MKFNLSINASGKWQDRSANNKLQKWSQDAIKASEPLWGNTCFYLQRFLRGLWELAWKHQLQNCKPQKQEENNCLPKKRVGNKMPPLGEVRSVITMSIVIAEVLKSEGQSCKTKRNCFKNWHFFHCILKMGPNHEALLWLDLQVQNSQKIGFGIYGLGKFIWASQSLGMSSSVGVWLWFCSSSPRQMYKILCRTEPRAGLGHAYFFHSRASSACVLKDRDIVELLLCLCLSCFLVELGSTPQLLCCCSYRFMHLYL